MYENLAKFFVSFDQTIYSSLENIQEKLEYLGKIVPSDVGMGLLLLSELYFYVAGQLRLIKPIE